MIRLEGVSKRFSDGRPAVEALDLAVEEGETCALIGPSGCGKTTTLRMINRLIEPSSGRITVAGRDVMAADPVELRRGIGYVIQGVGLFPHRTVGQNVATVPGLLGWDAARTRDRVDEMLTLVGLDPATFRDRRPASLSGGQRQRAGVARALAADPPVLLMDEPFGAVDPLERARLQREIAAILKRLGKTVVLVTHDIDEAIRMGDRVALLRDGRLVQHDTPDRLLAAPADGFVAEFLGADRALKRLALATVRDAAEPRTAPPGTPEIAAEAGLDEALSLMMGTGADVLAVRGGGSITLAALRRRLADGSGEPVSATQSSREPDRTS